MNRRALYCYLCVPVSGLMFVRSRDPRTCFHAWQSVYLGCTFVLVLMGAGLLEVGVSLLNRTAGAMTADLAPLCGLLWIGMWVVCVVRVARHGDCRLPIIGTMVARRI